MDEKYSYNLKSAKENGFPVGSYHYFRTTSNPKEQFTNFKKTVEKEKQDLIPLVDVEEKRNWNSATFHKNFQNFLNMVEEHYGKKPLIYTVNSFYNRNLAGRYKSYKFLIGRYGSNKPFLKDNHTWALWQFSDKETVNGIPRKVDIDLLNNSLILNDLMLK